MVGAGADLLAAAGVALLEGVVDGFTLLGVDAAPGFGVELVSELGSLVGGVALPVPAAICAGAPCGCRKTTIATTKGDTKSCRLR